MNSAGMLADHLHHRHTFIFASCRPCAASGLMSSRPERHRPPLVEADRTPRAIGSTGRHGTIC